MLTKTKRHRKRRTSIITAFQKVIKRSNANALESASMEKSANDGDEKSDDDDDNDNNNSSSNGPSLQQHEPVLSPSYLKNVLEIIGDRVSPLNQIVELCPYFFRPVTYDSVKGRALLKKIGSHMNVFLLLFVVLHHLVP